MDFLLYDFLSFQILRQNIALSDPILDRIIAKSRAQLFAKGRNMDTYGVAEAVDASVPDMFDQFFRADDTILVKHKIFQQCGFLPGERKFFVVDAGFSCTGIKGDTSAFQADIFLNKFSPCQAADYARVFTILDEKTEIDFHCKDGDEVKKGDLMATVTGDIRVLLSGERVALNYLQRMSGIATYTRQVAKLLEGSNVTLLDTRKTTPNCRVFEKYAVRVGGGCNHRYNLSDGVLLKDNHIGAAGSVTKAVQMAKAYAPFVRKIEIEVETLDQVKEAVEAGADIIMLDNMTPEVMKQAVELIDGRAQTECSGNITKENIQKIREIGVDFVSSGALTHSAPILDISMKNLHAV